MLLLQIPGLLIIGALIIESTGYVWHRWACHFGCFRMFNDFLRRRHYDHHIHKYKSGDKLRTKDYHESCEISFHFLGILVAGSLILVTALGWISWWVCVLIIIGEILHGKFVLGGLHTLYHVHDEVVKKNILFRNKFVWNIFYWLRDYHDIHHIVNANYAIALPIFDMLGGTFVSPERLNELKTENLFPEFDPELSSSCNGPVFSKK